MAVKYRVLVTATKGEQLVVERQYANDNFPHDWMTTDKYLTADLRKLPARTRPWMTQVPETFHRSEKPKSELCECKEKDAAVCGQNPSLKPSYCRVEGEK